MVHRQWGGSASPTSNVRGVRAPPPPVPVPKYVFECYILSMKMNENWGIYWKSPDINPTFTIKNGLPVVAETVVWVKLNIINNTNLGTKLLCNLGLADL